MFSYLDKEYNDASIVLWGFFRLFCAFVTRMHVVMFVRRNAVTNAAASAIATIHLIRLCIEYIFVHLRISVLHDCADRNSNSHAHECSGNCSQQVNMS